MHFCGYVHAKKHNKMFFYSLPLLFTEIGGLTELELSLIALGLFIILYALSFFSEKDTQKKTLDNYLLSA